MVINLGKFKNVDVMQALNILSVTDTKQLREVEKVLKFELDKCEGAKGKEAIQKTIDILCFVGILADK